MTRVPYILIDPKTGVGLDIHATCLSDAYEQLHQEFLNDLKDERGVSVEAASCEDLNAFNLLISTFTQVFEVFPCLNISIPPINPN